MMAPVTVITNSFEIKQQPRRTYHHYDVVIQKAGQDSPRTGLPARRAHEIIAKMQDMHAGVFNPKGIYDGRANFFMSKPIDSASYQVQMGLQPGRGVYDVRLQRAASIDTNVLQRLTQRGGLTPETNTIAVNLLQLIIRQDPNRRHGFPPEARSFYVERDSRELHACHALMAHRGYFQSVRPVLGRLLVNVDTANAILYTPGQLDTVALDFCGIRDMRALGKLHNDITKWRQLEKFLKNVQIKVKIPVQPAGHEQIRIIKGLVPKAGHFTFDKDGELTTIQQHYQNVHAYTLKHPDVFGVKISKTAVIPAEACDIIGGQLYKKKLRPDLQADFIRFAEQKPAQRLQQINAAVTQTLGYLSSITLQEAGMVIAPQALMIQAQMLATPRIQYGGQRMLNIEAGAGAWNVKNSRFYSPRNIPFWAVVSFCSSGKLPAIQGFITALVDNLGRLGIQIFCKEPVIVQGNPTNVAQALQDAGNRAVDTGPSRQILPDVRMRVPTIIMVVLPQSGAEIRSVVKWWGDANRGVATQCIREGKFEGGNDQYRNNVALKINAKIGGTNSLVLAADNQDISQQFLKVTMVVGVDVTHPAPGITTKPSISAVVASQDADQARFSTQLNVQQPRQEKVDNIGTMIANALDAYIRFNQDRGLPQYVLVYRDGISEGEYAHVAESEINDIQSAMDKFAALGGKPTPKLLFIVVGKRHHVRFFPRDGEGDRSGNCRSGLVVDNTVTNTQIFNASYSDFYLQSHPGLKGTSRPSHYVVVHNKTSLALPQIQQLSFALCHVYASATRAVSIPAPVYYADRACARAAYHFDPSNNNLNLEDDATTATGSANEIDLNRWKQGLKQPVQFSKMYFL